ncbi:putative B3 domain-containing protein At4g03170 [Raphanus sativus]|uniref:B3 domain-containing protein At4g03170 n=1 Tax=Raphanus sativus TaxID=3726 RepID=A0A9W3DIH9_RAPSA|nr:putative B3 domain-containing protein At4g03170 [Raphanus sativus]
MATSKEETTSVVITREDREAAEILIELSQDTRYQPIEEEDAARSSTLLLQQISKKKNKKKKQVTKSPQKSCSFKAEEKQHSRKDDKLSKKGTKRKREVDDTDETLRILQEWNRTKPVPVEELFKGDADVAELFSEPIKKQLTMSDVEIGQGRLMLGKQQVQKKMLPLLEHSELPQATEGLDVSVYGPNGKVQTMKFKMWSDDTPVLTSGWNDFVDKYKLKKHRDFLTIWMFRHRVTRGICFAIDRTRFPVTGPLSLRILKSVFPNPN